MKVESPDFPNLKDDFEKIIIKNSKKKIIIKGVERFIKTKSDMNGNYNSSLLKTINENQKIFELKRNKFIKNKLSDFIKNRKKKVKIVNQNKNNLIKEEEKEFQKQIIKQYKTTNNYFAREINYDLIENSSPKYTIKGKYRYDPFLSYQSYYGSTDDIFKSYDEDDDDNEYTTSKNKQKNLFLLENPNYDKVKPRCKAFSFGSSERFKTYNQNFNSTNNSIEKDLFKEGNFGYEDTKSFLKVETMMGKEKKFRCYKDNGVPGPGNYTIRSFAEDILKKGNLINNIRQKIKEKNDKIITNNINLENKNKVGKKKANINIINKSNEA